MMLCSTNSALHRKGTLHPLAMSVGGTRLGLSGCMTEMSGCTTEMWDCTTEMSDCMPETLDYMLQPKATGSVTLARRH